MITPHVACLVRRWVSLYTSGLAAEARDRRRDEVAADLWSQAEESRELARSDGTTAAEMLIRLIAGIPADITWRLEKRGVQPRNPVDLRGYRESRATGGAAIIGGLLLCASLMTIFITLPSMGTEAAWRDPFLGPLLVITTSGGIGALALATLGLVVRHLDRLRGISAPAGAFAFLAGALAALGPFPLVVVLAAGSALLVRELGSIQALDHRVVAGHVAAGVAFALVVIAAIAGTPLGVVGVLLFAYPISWIAIGRVLLRGPSIGDLPAHS